MSLIFCSVLEEEVKAVIQGLANSPSLYGMPQGLHNEPPRLRTELQKAVNQIESEFKPDAILLGYGLCSRGIEGVTTKTAKLVIPRAHDCITLLLGSRKRYSDYVNVYPATYFYSVGWNKHHIPPGPKRVEILRAEYTEKYGEDNADFLMESEQHWLNTYERATFIDTGVGPRESEAKRTQDSADFLGWKYDQQEGSLDLIRALISGDWNQEDFLVLEPGQTAKMTADDEIITNAD
ncbi:MAG: DUF1638 domain-containing protein [Fimbriimonadaceae bacterium]|jgi:hypothetical protein|nr:DUF1638 domain-containing protein [Fimbriimonadaceae bacterium]